MRSLWSLPSWRDISCVPGALPSPCERKQDRERKRVLLGSLGPWIQPLLKSRSLKTFQLHGPLNPPVYTGGEGVSFSSFAARVLAPEVSIHGSVSSSHTEHGPAFWRFRGTCRGIQAASSAWRLAEESGRPFTSRSSCGGAGGLGTVPCALRGARVSSPGTQDANTGPRCHQCGESGVQ